MSKPVLIKIKTSTGWDEIYPETSLEQIANISDQGRKLVKTLSNTAGYLRVKADGTAEIRTMGQVASDISASLIGHKHSIADIDQDTTDLQTELNRRAEIVDGKIKTSNIPNWLFGGLKYHSVINADKTIASSFSELGITSAGKDEEKGQYYIVTKSGGVTLTPGTNVKFTTGDDGDSSGTEPIKLEQNDWLVYRGKNGTNHEFDIVNNTYDIATTQFAGVIKVAAPVSSRASLSGQGGNHIIDQAALKAVMKDIFYTKTEPSNTQTGDLWFQDLSN